MHENPSVPIPGRRLKAEGARAAEVASALQCLRDRATNATREGLARYGIPSDRALGVAMRDIKALGKKLGRDQELAVALWKTGIYEARLLAAFVGEPAALTSAVMDRWCRDFDNWALCDTLAFHLFDRSPLAWEKVALWSRRSGEFEKRTAFALLWSLTVHDKQAADGPFHEGLALIEREAGDERNFVKKAVNMALRAVGKRNRDLRTAAMEVAGRLADSSDASARWVGRDALKELMGVASRDRREE